MENKYYPKQIINKQSLILLILLYSSLILAFLFNENSNGGAYLDYFNQNLIVDQFKEKFKISLLNYDKFNTRHSPVLISLLSFLKQLNITEDNIRILHAHISLLLPFSFFLILKNKFLTTEKNNEIFYILVGLIFLSPTFRSLSIWPDSRLIGLTLFTFSILFYVKFERYKLNKYVYLNILFYTISSYFSPNFSVFSIFFVLKYLKYFGFSKKIFGIVIINILLSLPAIYYIFFLDINFLNKSAAVNDANIDSIFFQNIFNQILIIPTIFLFYLFPFIILKIIEINKKNLRTSLLISLPIFCISIIFFDYSYEYTGGGIYFKLSYFFFKNNYFFYLVSLFSILIIINILNNKFYNILILLILIFSTPQITIYHKYFDPLLIILFFSIFSFKINFNLLSKKNNKLFLYFYFLGFLCISIIKNHL